MRARSLAVALSCLFATSCYSGAEDLGPSTVYRGINGNDMEINGTQNNGTFLQGTFLQGTFLQGTFLQGTFLQGTFLQGIFLQGTFLQGTFLQGTFLQGETLNDMELDGSVLSAVLTVDGEPIHLQGEDFIGAVLNFNFSQDVDGEVTTSPISMRIDDIYPSAENDEVFQYMLSMLNPDTEEWVPLCIDFEGEPAAAIPLNGIWDSETGDRLDDEHGITFACPDGALAKCVNWGYVPWETALSCKKKKKKKKKGKKKKKLVCEEVNLRDYHQACTRMARADYCGDGVPHTINGTLIDIGDSLKPRIQAFETEWDVEAEWNPDGAYCITDNLRALMIEEADELPACFDDIRRKKNCGKMKKNRSMMATRFELAE